MTMLPVLAFYLQRDADDLKPIHFVCKILFATLSPDEDFVCNRVVIGYGYLCNMNQKIESWQHPFMNTPIRNSMVRTA